jgi:hypothetical protein
MNYELVQKLLECAMACEDCVKADRQRGDALTNCARLNRDCADICLQAISFLKRNSELTGHYLKLCEEVCLLCAKACEGSYTEDGQRCVVACNNCAQACKRYYVSAA